MKVAVPISNGRVSPVTDTACRVVVAEIAGGREVSRMTFDMPQVGMPHRAIFLAGLEIIDDKLIDIDVFSPGGLGTAQLFEKVNFNEAVIHALEQKVDYMAYYRRRFDNVDMATL